MGESNIAAKRHDKIIEILMDLKERTSKIEEHLKSLNGKVVAQEKRLQTQEEKISIVQKHLYKGIGGLTVLMIVIQLAMM